MYYLVERDWPSNDVEKRSLRREKRRMQGANVRGGRMTDQWTQYEYSMIDLWYFLSRDIMTVLSSGGQFAWQNDVWSVSALNRQMRAHAHAV